jgi:hypothetical protein
MYRVQLGRLFPYLPKQPGYHKHITAAPPLIRKATAPGHAAATRVVLGRFIKYPSNRS